MQFAFTFAVLVGCGKVIGAGLGAGVWADVTSSPEQSSGASETGDRVSRHRNGSMFGCGPNRAVALRICWVGASLMLRRRSVVGVVAVVEGGGFGVRTGGGR